MKLTLKVIRLDDEYEVVTNLGTIIAWERRFKTKASDMANGVGAEDLAFLAWEASRQAKIVVPAAFDDFIAKLQRVDVVNEEQVNPTQGEPTVG